MATRKKVPRAPIVELREMILGRYAERESAPQTLHGFRRIFGILEDDLGVSRIDELECANVIRRFEGVISNYKETTRRTMLMTLYRSLVLAEEKGLLRSVPPFPDLIRTYRLPKSEATRAPSAADLDQYIESLRQPPDDWENARIRNLVMTVAWGGFNPGQSLRMRVSDLDVERKTIAILGTRARRELRSGPPAHSPIDVKLVAELAAWAPLTGCEWLFPGIRRLGPWHAADAWRELERTSRDAGVQLTFQSLRRYFVETAVPTTPAGASSLATRPNSATSPAPARAALELGPEGYPVTVRGVEKRVPSPMVRKAIKLLLDAYPGGLDGKEMLKGYGSDGWNTLLDRFRKQDDDLKSAILFPRERPDDPTAGLYRIAGW